MGILYVLFVLVMIISPMIETSTLNNFDKKVKELEKGMSLEDVCSLLGQYTSISEMLHDYLIQWQYNSASGGYHVAILFDNNLNLKKISHISRV